jgi:SagB-type dehydrogenase family enzyme
MSNRDTRSAWGYHDATKHTVARLRAHPHNLDWDNRPRPFKTYRNIESIPLPRRLGSPGVAAIKALTATTPPGEGSIELEPLARLLHLCAGIVRAKVYGEEEHYFRAAACTGALYHIDVYLIGGALSGLEAGVYHFEPRAFALNRLRRGDFRGNLAAACANQPDVEHAPVTLALASTYWRNSWKYQTRAYRHCFWDAGTMLANLLAAAASDGLPARIVSGFVDAQVESLLALDPEREGVLSLVPLGGAEPAPTPETAIPTLSIATEPLSPREIDYPAIREMHTASALTTPDEVHAWQAAASRAQDARQDLGSTLATDPALDRSKTISLSPLKPNALPDETLDEVIRRRGSSRQFVPTAITFEQLSTVLETAAHTIPADWGGSPSSLYLIVNAVDGLAPGAYVLRRNDNSLEMLREGSLRSEAGYLALGQELAADASVSIYMLCDLEPVLAAFGNRGYRSAQLDAAITGGKIYLAAYALRLGATGLTFFDDDVIELFSPHAAGKSVLFLIAVGHGRRPLRAV